MAGWSVGAGSFQSGCFKGSGVICIKTTVLECYRATGWWWCSKVLAAQVYRTDTQAKTATQSAITSTLLGSISTAAGCWRWCRHMSHSHMQAHPRFGTVGRLDIYSFITTVWVPRMTCLGHSTCAGTGARRIMGFAVLPALVSTVFGHRERRMQQQLNPGFASTSIWSPSIIKSSCMGLKVSTTQHVMAWGASQA